ncbi:capsid protein [Mute swan feces associated circular virus 6]|nr:capsid protein [Mute swan feces associated circular virus 6]
MYRRRFIRRRRVFRKKRTFRRRFRRSLRTGAYTKRLFKLRRVVTINSAANEPTWQQFNDNPSLSQDWTAVSELFQMYRVNGLKLTWIPTFNASVLGTQANSIIVPLYYLHDTNMTITTIPSENQVLQYENLKIRNLTRMHSVYYKMARRINATAPGTLSTDGYSSVQNPQITQQIAILIPNLSSVGNSLGRFVITAYVSAKVRR